MEYSDKQKRIIKYIAGLDLQKNASGFSVTYFLNFDINRIAPNQETWFEMDKNELVDFLSSRHPNKEIDQNLINQKLHDAGISENESFFIHFR